ncbi:MAG TPA: hypothetical protein VKB66_02250 [Candidatus Acidoferrum sp.]|nr:hypothetical protein [Candidatus Acidoferrum sp.]
MAGRQSVGEIVGVKHRAVLKIFGAAFAALCVFLSAGCGGGSSANVVTVAVTPSTSLILGQSVTLTATVTGATNTNVTWSKLQYTTTSTTNGKTTTSNPIDAPTDGSFGVLSNQQATGTATYTAPDPAKFQVPDSTKYPGLQIVITATSVQDTKKSGKANIVLISGIRAVITPITASVPTKESQQFFANLTNDIQNQGTTWLLTQNVPNTDSKGNFINYPALPTCSPNCGTITPDTNNPNVAVYTAPDTIPTAITPAQTNNTNVPFNVTIVATPKADSSGFVTGTITMVTGGPIAFNGITPTIAPQGGAQWDIYLDAPNISSASKINLIDSAGGTTILDSTSGQIKILFPLPTTSTSTSTTPTPPPASTGARVRLNANNLFSAGTFTISVVDPAQPCNGNAVGTSCTATGAGTFTVIPVRPTSTATVPNDVVQGANTQDTKVTVTGGYFGPGLGTISPGSGSGSQGKGSLASVYFQSLGNAGDLLSLDSNNPSTSHRLNAIISNAQVNSASPGLYPLYVASNSSTPPSPNNPSVTNMALFPDYSSGAPTKSTPPFPAGLNPSAIDIDPTLGVLAVAETGSNAIEFFSIGKGSLASLGQVTSTASAPINVPTGLSINRGNHTVAVVNYGTQTTTLNADGSCKQATSTGQSVTVLNIPGNPSPITPFSVVLPFAVPQAGVQGTSVCPQPMPFSIGVDPDSNLALVAYSSASASSFTNLGFIVNLNPDSPSSPPNECLLDQSINQSNKNGQCLFSQVTLNTGTYPHIAVSAHNHLAIVTPGGAGVVRGVDVTKPSNSNVLKSSTLAAGLVTVTIDPTQCPPPLPAPTSTSNPCPFSMIPGNAGSVLISGVSPGNAANAALFNGVFTATVTSGNSFTYVVPNASTSDSGSGGTVFYGNADLTFNVSNGGTTQGVAINPITSTAALADANSTGTNGPQIDLLSGLDQTSSSITFFAGCTAFTTTCSSAPELLATTEVAWQPYTNVLVSYNPKLGLVSVSDPVGRTRYAIVSGFGPSAASFPVMNGVNSNTTGDCGTSSCLTLWGGLAVDPATNQAFVLESGPALTTSNPPAPTPGQIEIVNLGPSTTNAPKPTHISEVIVPSPTPGPGVIGGIPNARVPQGTLTSTQPLHGVQIFGTGFGSGMQVRLDGVDIITQGGTIDSIAANGREVNVTIPAVLLAAPHHYALDVLSQGAQSNAVDFLVVQSVDLSKVCSDSTGAAINTLPTSIALADQIANGPFSPIGLVSVSGCNSIVELDLNPAHMTFGQQIGSPISVGTGPQGIAISQKLGLAVVANHGTNTVSVIDLTKNPPVPKVPDVNTGTSPTGVGISDATGAALVANFGSNTVSLLDLGSLFPPAGTTPPTTLTATSIGGVQSPIAVAIDPDRGTNNQGIAVVTAITLSSALGPSGSLDVVEIGFATPVLSTTISSGFVSSTPTGIVFDPTVVTNTANPGTFYANSSGTNSITQFNPDTGGGSSVSVGINPTSLAINPQTGAILTSNFGSNTVSIVDTVSSPFKTHQTLGIPGSPTFGVAIDQFTNLAVIVDQANMRVLLFPMPN